MIKTYKILSLLLSYPDTALQDFLDKGVTELKNEALLSHKNIMEIEKFAIRFGKMDLTDWQAEYVQLFDYSRSASLHLFEHVQGESKDRGQAMSDLLEFYRQNDMQLITGELPDYIPAFLEFLSLQEPRKASEILAVPVHIIHRIYLALNEKEHPYRYVLSAVVSLSSVKPDEKVTQMIIGKEKPLDLDKEYGEEPVEFGGNHSCTNG